jgi:hypothetical protein
MRCGASLDVETKKDALLLRVQRFGHAQPSKMQIVRESSRQDTRAEFPRANPMPACWKKFCTAVSLIFLSAGLLPPWIWSAPSAPFTRVG